MSRGLRGSRSSRFGAAMAAGVMMTGLSVNALADGGPETGQYFFTVGGVYQHFDSNRDIELEPGGGWQFGVGRRFTDNWGIEGVYNRIEADAENSSQDSEIDNFRVDVLGFLDSKYEGVQPYVVGGIGYSDEDSFRNSSDDEVQFNFGLGVFKQIHDRFAVRGDIRGVFGTENDELDPLLSVGITYLLGEGTKKAMPAPMPAVATDTDGDGVPDSADRCPGTARGVPVNASGCARDADGDGVADNLDRCPRTPSGVAVDRRGCPLDSDGDGVADNDDKCPDTARGARVDADGCLRKLEQTVTIDLLLEFDTNSAQLRNSHYAEIDQVVSFLGKYPNSTVALEGHTDSRGEESYNQGLSERRAAAVRSYLVSKGIGASRLSSRGYGESRPKATNDTAEGRQRNRRVSAVVKGSG